MRPKVVIAVFLFVALAALGIYFLNKVQTLPSVKTAATPVPDPEPAKSVLPVQPAPPPASIPVVTALPAINTNQVAQDPAVISATVHNLETLEWNDDPASLQAILTEFTNSSPTVRHAAVEATIQFHDRAAIPVLKDLAANTENPDEKKELLDAAAFMALPTLSEARAAKKAGQPTSPPQ